MRPVALPILLSLVLPAMAIAAPMTADEAVKIALQKNSSVIQAEASVLSARSGLWSAYAGLVPNVSGAYDWSRLTVNPSDEIHTQIDQTGASRFSRTLSFEQTTKTPLISADWRVLSLQNWSNFSSARHGMTGAKLSQRATRNDIALEARRRFYSVVRAIRLAEVATGALKLARDDERRVRALFEVGSVSKSDLLKARVRTSQSKLDSLVFKDGVTNARISLAGLLGVAEAGLSEVDTTLVGEHRTFDAAALLSEARTARPDLLAANHELMAAQAGLNAARWQRLPQLDLSGSYNFKRKTQTHTAADFFSTAAGTGSPDFRLDKDFESTSDPSRSVAVALSVPLFDGFVTDARIASARANLIRAKETHDALARNLESEVHQALLGYEEAVERESLGRETLESATENLNLVQQKYNVGSSTILDLIDSQVQLQRAQSDLVSALADIRIAEAAVDRVRGKSE